MKNAHPVSEVSAPDTADSNITETSRRAQCKRIAAHLSRHQSATTLELRSACNALYPPARVLELREAGWEIITTYIRANDEHGRPHRVGRYTLLRAGGAV